MKLHITIFSYEREAMLRDLIDEIKAFSGIDVSYSIIDDGSSFTLNDNFYQFEHGGKAKFWRMWDYALRSLINNTSDIFLFIPSDVSSVDFKRIIQLHTQFNRTPYAYNVINDGRVNCWNMVTPKPVDSQTSTIGFTDCGFFCNKGTLNKIGYYVNESNNNRFAHNKSVSSGVGQQLTFRMRKHEIPMYIPTKSLAFHGNHPSLMHPSERIKTPLVSK